MKFYTKQINVYFDTALGWGSDNFTFDTDLLTWTHTFINISGVNMYSANFRDRAIFGEFDPYSVFTIKSNDLSHRNILDMYFWTDRLLYLIPPTSVLYHYIDTAGWAEAGFTVSNEDTFKKELCTTFKNATFQLQDNNGHSLHPVWENNVNFYLYKLTFNDPVYNPGIVLYIPLFYEGNTIECDSIIEVL